MKPAPFDLHRPDTLAEAVETLAGFGDDAKVLAGGQSLVPLLALRLVSPPHLVDLDRVDELREIAVTDGHVRLGAMVRHEALARDATAARSAPLLARAVPYVGHSAIRNRGTLGGSLAHADAAAEHPAVCLALGATMELVGANGTRTVGAEDFFVSTFQTALEPDEVLAAVHVPVAGARSGYAIDELARRRGDFALAGAACRVGLGDDGRIDAAGIALFGVADRPWQARAAEQALIGAGVDVDVDEIAALAVQDLAPGDTLHARGPYLVRVARVLVSRCLRRALDEAEGRDG